MKLPDDSQRVVICGRTGSGKTTEALHHLSQRSIDTKPWIVLDFKGDDMVSALPVTAPWTVDQAPPTEPGLYVVRCTLDDAEPRGKAERFLLAMLEQGNCGLLVDEGYMFKANHRGLRFFLTQGRSKHCPLIFLTQRPAHIDTFVLSECEYIQLFLLQHPDDHERIARFVPEDRLEFGRLRQAGPHHSFWFDTRTDDLELLGPSPTWPEIYDRILTRLPRYEEEAEPELPRRVRL